MTTEFSIDKIKRLFYDEFLPIKDLFKIFEIKVSDLEIKKGEGFEYKPGVYVFFTHGEVWRVGRSFTNSRKRASEHIRDNTHNGEHHIESLKNDTEAIILLFNTESPKIHWVAALEIFFEQNLNPIIRSGRLG